MVQYYFQLRVQNFFATPQFELASRSRRWILHRQLIREVQIRLHWYACDQQQARGVGVYGEVLGRQGFGYRGQTDGLCCNQIVQALDTGQQFDPAIAVATAADAQVVAGVEVEIAIAGIAHVDDVPDR